jgi:hypothetical protein
VPTTITVADEHADTDSYIAFFTAATGDLGPKTTSNLTFDSHTGGMQILGGVSVGANTTDYGRLAPTYLEIVESSSAVLTLNPAVANGGSAVAYMFDTVNALTTTAKIASFKNNGSEVAYIDQDGTLHAKDFVLIP